MPPKIRSPTPDSEYDELDEDPVPRHALPIHLSLPATASTSRQASFTSTPASAFQGAPTSDDDDLSSLEDSDDDSRARQQEMYAQMERSDDEHEHARSAGRAYSEEDVEMDELDQLDDDDEDEEQDDEFAPTSKKGRTAPRAPATASSASASGQASGIKIKFKLGGGGAAAAAVPRAPSSVAGSSAKGSASKRGGGKKGKGKKKASFDDGSDDLDDSDDFDSDASGSSSVGSGSGQRLTARQRAKEMGGEFGMELQSLPNRKGPVVQLSEAEIALRKSEISRKRKHQSDKRLEDEKTETINRLLKKQVGKQRSKLSTSTTVNSNNQSGGGTDEADVDGASGGAAVIPRPPAIPVTSRWISSIKSGEYSVVVGLPNGRRELGGEKAAEARGKEPVYPGPRPPLKTRRLVRT